MLLSTSPSESQKTKESFYLCEANLDSLRDLMDMKRLFLRSLSLRDHAAKATGIRKVILHLMEKAYIAQGLAIGHRKNQRYEMAEQLEADAREYLREARQCLVRH